MAAAIYAAIGILGFNVGFALTAWLLGRRR